MKKMNIALFTAAAISVSGMAAAQTDGPNFSGRVDIRFTDTEGADVAGSNASSKLALSGTGDAMSGISTFYYGRISLNEALADDADTTSTNEAEKGNDVDYILAGFEGDFGRLSVGIDDDLVYKHVGSNTDLYRGLSPSAEAMYSTGHAFGEDPSVQYSFSVDAFTIGAYVNTGDAGIDRTQIAASADFGMVNLGIAYADRSLAAAADGSETSYDSETFFGGTVDLGVASLHANMADRTTGTTNDGQGDNPYHVAAKIPLNDMFTATVGYDYLDDAAETANTHAMVMANLGGGVDLNLSVRNGDSADGVSAGLRYSF